MDLRRLVLALILASLLGCGNQPANKMAKMVKEETYFKNFGLAVCLSSSFKIDELTDDLSKAGNGYSQRGNVSPDAYDEIRRLAKVWQAKDYPSKHGGQVKSAKCIDFYHSDDLHQLYLKYTPCQSTKGWWSKEDYIESCRVGDKV